MHNPVKFILAWSGAFFANRMPMALQAQAASPKDNDIPKAGKGRGRRAHKPSGIAKMRRSAKKARNVARNRAHHA